MELFQNNKNLIQKHETKCENIDEMVEFYVAKIKDKFVQYNEEGIVNIDGSINTRRYIIKNGGPFKKEEVKQDERLKDELMREWASDFYDLEADASIGEIEKATEEYRNLKKSGYGEKLEKLLFINLNRMLAPDYFVMHSSEYDDTANGVDFVIVEASTGIVACGFDGVYDEKGGERHRTKIKKLRKKAEKNGASIKYGFKFQNGEIIKQSLHNLPNLFLNMNLEDIRRMEKEMNFLCGEGQNPSEFENDVFDKLLSSLENQLDDFRSNEKINSKVRENLDIFEKVIERVGKRRGI
jgi:hypothetical protein